MNRSESNYSANQLQPQKREERYNMKYDIRCKNVCCKTKYNYSANQLQPQKQEARYNMKYDIRCKNVCCKTIHNYSANQLQPQKREEGKNKCTCVCQWHLTRGGNLFLTIFKQIKVPDVLNGSIRV